MVMPEATIRASSPMSGQQQARTMEMMGGPQFNEAMQGMIVGTKGAGKGSIGGDSLKGIPKPMAYKGEQYVHAEWNATLLAYLRGEVRLE